MFLAVDFLGALEAAGEMVVRASSEKACYLVETGAHPVLISSAKEALESHELRVVASSCSMHRRQPAELWFSEAARLRDTSISLHPAAAGRTRDANGIRSHRVAGEEQLRSTVLSTVRKPTNRSIVDVTIPLMQAGLSINAEDFAEELQSQTGLKVSTLMFEHGTIAGVTDCLARQLVGEGLPSRCPLVDPLLRRRILPQQMWNCACTGRWPGATHHFATLAAAGGDAILQAPAMRWVVSEGMSGALYGGFVCGPIALTMQHSASRRRRRMQ